MGRFLQLGVAVLLAALLIGSCGGGNGASTGGRLGGATPGPNGDPQGGGGKPAKGTPDDLKSYVYCLDGMAKMGADAAQLSTTAETLAMQLDVLDVNSARTTSQTLERQARFLAADAATTLRRLGPLKPRIGVLARARRECLDVVRIAESYASEAVSVADVVRNRALVEAAVVAKQVRRLVGRGADLEAAAVDALTAPTDWAASNPTQAAAAEKRFGKG